SFARAGFSANTIAYDFGVHYLTGFESLKFAFSVRNFSGEVNFDDENSEIPLTMRIGLSMDVLDLTEIDKEMNSLIISIDANRPRDFDEQIYFGADYTFMKMFSIRAGARVPNISDDERGLTFGAGIIQEFTGYNLRIDYGYTDFGVFNNVNTFSL